MNTWQFKPNLCALDLEPLLKDINAKSIFIPRQSFKYLQRPWAFVAFDSEIQKDSATERTGLAFHNQPLFWSARDKSSAICLSCGDNRHLYKDCPNRSRRSNPKIVSDRWPEAYNRFRPAGHKRAPSSSRSRSRPRNATRKLNVSYAEAANTSNNTL